MFEDVVIGVKDHEAGEDALALTRQLVSPDASLTLASVYVAVLVPPPKNDPG
jgi:hypothetical protein